MSRVYKSFTLSMDNDEFKQLNKFKSHYPQVSISKLAKAAFFNAINSDNPLSAFSVKANESEADIDLD